MAAERMEMRKTTLRAKRSASGPRGRPQHESVSLALPVRTFTLALAVLIAWAQFNPAATDSPLSMTVRHGAPTTTLDAGPTPRLPPNPKPDQG